MNWESIETAPRDGTIIELRDEKKAHHCAMCWDKRRKLWTGMAFGPMGSTKIHWDYESSHNCDHECCNELWAAQNQYWDLKRKVKLSEAA